MELRLVRRESSWDSRVVILVRRVVRWGFSCVMVAGADDGGAEDGDDCSCCGWWAVGFSAGLNSDD